MVLEVISNKEDVMPHHFFPQGLSANADYKKVLEMAVRPWIYSMSKEILYTNQQDSALSHKAKTTQEWMSHNLHNNITPNI